MNEALTAEKPRSGKTVLACLLVILLLAAFGFAFLELDGVGYVSGALSRVMSLVFPVTPASGPSGSAPKDTGAAQGLILPPGLDETFAKRMYVEQLESETNITKLVAGEVSGFTISAVTTVTGGVEVPIRAWFRDKTSGPGRIGLARKGDGWFFVYLAGRRPSPTGGQADTVAEGNTEGLFNLSSDDTPLSKRTVDKDVLNTVLDQQVKNQALFAAIVVGTYDRATVDRVRRGMGTATIDMTLTGPKTVAMKGRMLCISKSIDGIDTWFVTSLSKS